MPETPSRRSRPSTLDAVSAPSSEPDDGTLRAADGRVPGRRGRATRARLLECTAEMLETRSYRELKVVDIARGAGTSPATFYQYFPDVESAILVLAEEMSEHGLVLGSIVRDGAWKGKQAYATSAALVDAFMAFWDANRSLLRVVDLATIEGDLRFRDVRSGFLRDLTAALSQAIEKAQPDELDPQATGAVLTSMLAQVAAYRHGFEFWGIRVDHSQRSMTRIVAMTVTGQKPPTGV